MLTIEQLNLSVDGVNWSKWKATCKMNASGRAVYDGAEIAPTLNGTTLTKTEGLTIAEAFEAHAAGWVVLDEEFDVTLTRNMNSRRPIKSFSIWKVTRHKDGKPVEEAPTIDREAIHKLIESSQASVEDAIAGLRAAAECLRRERETPAQLKASS